YQGTEGRGIERRVASRDSILNGLRKKPTAPALSARRFMASSAWADIKMIGTSNRDAFRRCCNSRPLMPGRFTSRIRQTDARDASESRNSSAEPNTSTLNPAALMARHNMRDIEGSSSTTEINGFACGMLVLSLPARKEGQNCTRVQVTCTKVQYAVSKEERISRKGAKIAKTQRRVKWFERAFASLREAQIFNRSAIRTSSATESAFIFCTTCARCALIVRSLVPSLCAICLFSDPSVTSAKTSRSRLVSES